MAEGEFVLMTQHLEEAIKLNLAMGAVRGSELKYYALLADAAAQQKDPVGLQKYAPLAEESAASIDHKLFLAIAHRSWGVAHTLAGDYFQAEARLMQALEIFTGYPAPWQIGRTLFELGELARVRMETEQARNYFLRALNAFEDLQAAPYAKRSRDALETLGQV